ncbi:MAG TPA: hypothetical protein DCX78_04150 [Nitrospina sp.]|nr:hypothetical protein [Nitrospinota bacterium]HAX46007.1 hypothetical protein [Nitrospina sp.]
MRVRVYKIFCGWFFQGLVAARLINRDDSKRNEVHGFVCYDKTVFSFYCRNLVSTEILCRVLHPVAISPHPRFDCTD